MKSQDLKKYLSTKLKTGNLPDKPGVYFFLSKNKILYIGKATSLRDRVKSYFSKDLIATRGPLILDMVFKANGLKWTETDSVLEALILEAKLIKEHQPYYNTKEKDDKSWNYVCITKDKLPLVIVERGKNIDFESLKTKNYKLATVFGPFTNGSQLREAMKIIRRIFPYIDKSSALKDPSTSLRAGNYEFYRQLGLAPDVTITEAFASYRKNIRHLKLFFDGKKKQIVRSLEKEMKKYAKEKKFEEAGKVRNQIFALKHINDVALLKSEPTPTFNLSPATFRIESYDIAHMSGKNMVGVMTVVTNGIPDKSEYRKFIIRTQAGSNDTGALEEMLSRRLRHAEWGLPDLIVIDGGRAQVNLAERVLLRYQFAIPVVSVVKDEFHRPREILGDKNFTQKLEKEILLANSEAHRFAITFHKQKRNKSFLQ